MPKTFEYNWDSPLSREDLGHLVESYRIFVDTCSLMIPSAEAFFYQMLPSFLLEKHASLIVPAGVIQEIKKHQKSSKTLSAAKKAEKIIASYIDQNIAELRGEKNDPFVDSLFLSLFQRFRTDANLALITQDAALAGEILELNRSRAVKSKYQIAVFRINNSGLTHFSAHSKRRTANSETIYTRHTKKGVAADRHPKNENVQRSAWPKPPSLPIFQKSERLVSEKDEILSVKQIPEKGAILTDSNSRIVSLDVALAQGGEGTIYATSDTGRVAKIYKRERISRNRQQKLELMVERQISAPGICWPESILYDRNRQFVGYLMTKAKGAPIQQRLFIRPIFQRTYPLWDRANLLRFTLSVLEKIQILNDQNVIIGDINPNNILSDGEDSYFVDTDSYQLEGYPCPVGTINYTAPEIQRKEFPTFLRTQEHENFAIATLVFMLLLPGKPPYSHQGGGDPLANIMKREFSYPLQDKSNQKTPEGPWRYIWSNLPFKLKQAIYGCFRDGKRPSVDEWIEQIEHYLFLVTKNPPFVVPTLYPSHLKPISRYVREKYGVEE